MKKFKWYELADKLLKEQNLSQTEFGERMNVTQGAIGNWLNQRRKPDLEKIMEIFKYLDVRSITFDTDDASVSIEQLQVFDEKPSLKMKGIIEFRSQPIGELKPCEERYIHYYSKDFKAYALQVNGKILEPRLVSGEYIIVEPSTKIQNYDDVLIIKPDGRCYICLLIVGRNQDDRYLNPNTMVEYQDLEVTEGDQILYIAGIVKKERT